MYRVISLLVVQYGCETWCLTLRDASPNIRVMKSRMRWVGHLVRMQVMRNPNSILIGKSEGERLLGRPRRRWLGIETSGGTC
jgi:hypothetical protein